MLLYIIILILAAQYSFPSAVVVLAWIGVIGTFIKAITDVVKERKKGD